jgi:hypothetical protein
MYTGGGGGLKETYQHFKHYICHLVSTVELGEETRVHFIVYYIYKYRERANLLLAALFVS